MKKSIGPDPCLDLAWVGQDLICQACGAKCTEGVDHYCAKFGHEQSVSSAPEDDEGDHYGWQL